MNIKRNQDILLRQHMIGQKLKTLYVDVVEEPIPEGFAHVFSKLPGTLGLEGSK